MGYKKSVRLHMRWQAISAILLVEGCSGVSTLSEDDASPTGPTASISRSNEPREGQAAKRSPGGPAPVVRRYAWVDPAADMWPKRKRAPDAVNADIRHVSIRHLRSAVVIRMEYTDLVPNDMEMQVMAGYIQTNEVTRWFSTFRTTRDSEFEAHFYKGDRLFKCAAVVTTDFQAGIAEMRIPSTCLSSPRWVRASLYSHGSSRRSDGSSNVLTDNAMDAGPVSFPELMYTPRILRE